MGGSCEGESGIVAIKSVDQERRQMVMTRFGLAGPFGPRPTVPHQFWGMNWEEIVKTLMDEGFSRKTAEREAGEFLAYRDGAKEQPSEEEDARNDSVSGMSIGDRIQKAFGHGGPER
jgi:hypothetical protein